MTICWHFRDQNDIFWNVQSGFLVFQFWREIQIKVKSYNWTKSKCFSMEKKSIESLSDPSPPVYFLTWWSLERNWTLVFIVIEKGKHVSYIRFSSIVKHFFCRKSKGPLTNVTGVTLVEYFRTFGPILTSRYKVNFWDSWLLKFDNFWEAIFWRLISYAWAWGS